MSSVTLNGRAFHNGDILTFNKQAIGICHGPNGLNVQIMFISGDSVGLYSPNTKIPKWSDLDGEVESRRGWWIDKQHLEKCIGGYGGDYEIATTFEHRGVELKGKSCRMLAGLDDGTVFVEFEEDVNGCSADGLGKSGYCVAVRTKILTRKKREKHAQ